MEAPKFAPTQHEYIGVDGGFDLLTPPLQLPSGMARLAQNFECSVVGGYSRIAGYERFDGRPAPSAAAYALVAATITGSWAVGNTITGVTSGATGVIIFGSDAGFAVTKITGTFVVGEVLNIAGSPVATTLTAAVIDAAADAEARAFYRNAAADSYRADIAAVPGSGDIRGVWKFNDIVYAFRDNVGATACALYKSTSGGWSAVSLGFELTFSTGNLSIAEGTTVTGATSGATAVLKRAVLQSGTYGGGTAVGRFIFASVTGTFSAAENLQTGGVTRAVGGGAQTAITLLPGGSFEFEDANFGGTVNTKRIYGCDGVNRGFEFDGAVFMPIVTGMTSDIPRHVTIHKNHLFFSFGASVQHSGIGTPYTWSVITGAAELAAGDTVTGFMKQPGSSEGGALVVFMRNRIKVLYGNNVTDWNFVDYAREQGAYEWSIQQIVSTMMLDDRGVTNLTTTAAYGNFQHSTITHRIQTWLNERRMRVKHSCVSRDKNQYRLFFSDKYALYITMNGNKVRGYMPMLFVHQVCRICSLENNDGSESTYFGSTDGFIYQMERGTSFDGSEIEYFLDLAFTPSKMARQLKRYKNAMLEVRGEGYTQFYVTSTLGYGSTQIGQPSATNVVTAFSISTWDSFTWDQFTWDGVTLMPSEVKMEGTAENVSIRIYGSSDYNSPFTLTGVIFDYSIRRRMRG